MAYFVPALLILSAFGVLIATFAGASRLQGDLLPWIGLALIVMTCGSVAYAIVDFTVWVGVQAIITALYFLFYPVDSFARYHGVLAPLVVLAAVGITALVFAASGIAALLLSAKLVQDVYGIHYLDVVSAWLPNTGGAIFVFTTGSAPGLLLTGRPLYRKAKAAVNSLRGALPRLIYTPLGRPETWAEPAP